MQPINTGILQQSVPDLQLAKTIVFFDLETTGVDVNTDRIVELAMVKILPDQTVSAAATTGSLLRLPKSAPSYKRNRKMNVLMDEWDVQHSRNEVTSSTSTCPNCPNCHSICMLLTLYEPAAAGSVFPRRCSPSQPCKAHTRRCRKGARHQRQ
mgnify:CR=1 FL=1